ncbi:hypothetical protein PMAYCL1PPCAC_27546, partial [Pristionchus mayeri]
ECLLSHLPSELRFKIFDLLTESIGELRMVSKSWRQLVDNWAAVPVNLPELLQIDMIENEGSSMNVIIDIRKTEKACFGKLRSFVKQLPRESKNQMEESETTNFHQIYRVSIDLSFGSASIDRLSFLISTKCKKVTIAKYHKDKASDDGRHYINYVSDLMKNLKYIDELTYWRHDVNEESANLLRLIRQISIQNVTFSVDVSCTSFTLPMTRDFLLKIRENIEMLNCTFHATATNSNEGSDNVDWVETVLTMFQGSIQSIKMETHYVCLFTPNDVCQIAKALVARGEPFHFKTFLHEKPQPIIVKGNILRKKIAKFSNQWIIDLSSRPPPPRAPLMC